MRDAPAPPSANGFERRRRRNRAALLEAAISLFQAQGTRATKLEDICSRASVSQRTFFNHFETREHLYRAIASQRADQMAAAIDAQAADPRPFAERLGDLLSRMGEYLAARPAYRELVSEMLYLRPEVGNATVRTGSLGRAALRFLEDGVKRGEVTNRHRPEVLADLLLGAMTTALSNWSAGEDYDLEGELDRAASALIALFTAGPQDPPTH